MLKDDILRLRLEGKSYRQIQKELLISKSTVCYHLRPDQKEKIATRTRQRRGAAPLTLKLDKYVERETLMEKKSDFNKITKGRLARSKRQFNLKTLVEKIGPDPKCYLTGRQIDLADSAQYTLDHKIPVSRGGDNSLENAGLACRQANRAKDDLLLDEYLQLCKEVLEHNGFKVSK